MNETLSVDRYIDDIVPMLQKHSFDTRTTIQSFDWRTLVGIKRKFPYVTTVALLDDTTVVPNAAGNYPWLDNIALNETFDDDWVAAAHSIGAAIVSPVHGVPSNATVNTPGYVKFTTKDVVDRAHALGMKVVPWTVDYEVTVNKLIDDGVDAIISDYPELTMWIGKQRGLSVGRARNPSRPECLRNA